MLSHNNGWLLEDKKASEHEQEMSQLQTEAEPMEPWGRDIQHRQQHQN